MALTPEIIEALKAKRENLSDKHSNLKALIYGESGFGKTVETMKIAQAITPTGKTIEFIDFLEGWVALKNHAGLTDRTNRQQYEGLIQLEFLAEAIAAKIPGFDTIGTVVLDEISAMAKADLDVVLKARAKQDASKDPNVPTQPDFYANTERMRRAVTGLLQLDINVLFVAHIREDKLSNGIVVQRPALMPAFSETFRQMMHLVTNLSAVQLPQEDGTLEYKRSFQVHPTRSVSAKTRVGGLPVVVTSEQLITAITQWMKGERKSEDVLDNGENLNVLPDVDGLLGDSSEDVAISVE
jgi:hypothetical protein